MEAINLYSPENLHHKCYEQCAEFGWNPSKLGMFFRAYLLDGKTDFKHNKVLISLESYYNLVQYAQLRVIQKMELINTGKHPRAYDLLTPDELMKRYPDIAFIGWDAVKLGIFFKSSLLMGVIASHEKKSHIMDDSFRELVDFANTIYIKRHFIDPGKVGLL